MKENGMTDRIAAEEKFKSLEVRRIHVLIRIWMVENRDNRDLRDFLHTFNPDDASQRMTKDILVNEMTRDILLNDETDLEDFNLSLIFTSVSGKLIMDQTHRNITHPNEGDEKKETSPKHGSHPSSHGGARETKKQRERRLREEQGKKLARAKSFI
jgi:hypothetical protein